MHFGLIAMCSQNMVSLLKKKVTRKASKHFHRPAAKRKGSTCTADSYRPGFRSRGAGVQAPVMSQQHAKAVQSRHSQEKRILPTAKRTFFNVKLYHCMLIFYFRLWASIFLNACLRKYPQRLQSLILGEFCITWRTDKIKHLLLPEFTMLLQKAQVNYSGQL